MSRLRDFEERHLRCDRSDLEHLGIVSKHRFEDTGAGRRSPQASGIRKRAAV